MNRLPPEVINLIAIHIQALEFDKYNNIWISRNPNWRLNIANLRLAHPHLAATLKNVLFQQVDVTLHFNYWDAPDRLNSLLQLSQSQVAPCVQRLQIELSPGDVSMTTIFDQKGQARFFQDLAELLPVCLRNLPTLCSLHLICSRGDYGRYSEELIPTQYYEQVNVMLANILRHMNGNITDLTLRIPCTHTIDTIMKYDADRILTQDWYPLREKLSRLRCLDLEICDKSGPDGQRYYTKITSDLLKAFGPHEKYASSFFRFISMAVNLEALSISCTSVLDLDLLDPNNLRGLKQLALCNIRVRQQHLMRLLNLNAERLDSIWLTQVELYNGTWEAILVRCCEFPLLKQFEVLSCGYSKDGESAAFSRMFWADPRSPESIEGHRERDRHALGDLTRMVNKRRLEHDLLEITDSEEPSILLLPLADCGIDPEVP